MTYYTYALTLLRRDGNNCDHVGGVASLVNAACPDHHCSSTWESEAVAKVLPIMLLGLVALITTAMVEAFYGVFYLWHWVFDTAAPQHHWSTSIFVSALMTGVVLLAGRLGVLLIAPETGQSTGRLPEPEQHRRRSARLA